MSNPSYLDLLKEKKFIRLLVANMINRFGDSIDTIAFSWIVYAVTGEGKWAAIVFAVNKIPSFIVLPFAGAFVEKKEKKSVIILCDTVRCALVALLLLCLHAEITNLLVLLVFAFLISMTEALRFPASTSFITQILPDEKMSRGITLNVILSSVVELGGTGLAGVVISFGGITTALVMDIVTFILSNGIIACIKHIERIEKEMSKAGNTKIFLAGINHVLSNRMLLRTFILGCLANISMAPIDSLQTAMVVEVLNQNVSYLSVINTMLSIGMLFGGLIYPYLEERITGKALLRFAFFYIAFLYFSVAVYDILRITSTFVLYGLFAAEYFFYGIAAAFISTGCGLTLLRASRKDQIARTNTLFSAVCSAATPISATLSGMLAGLLPLGTLFAIIGSVICVSAICIHVKNKNDEGHCVN